VRKSELEQIIKEEIENVLQEGFLQKLLRIIGYGPLKKYLKSMLAAKSAREMVSSVFEPAQIIFRKPVVRDFGGQPKWLDNPVAIGDKSGQKLVADALESYPGGLDAVKKALNVERPRIQVILPEHPSLPGYKNIAVTVSRGVGRNPKEGMFGAEISIKDIEKTLGPPKFKTATKQ